MKKVTYIVPVHEFNDEVKTYATNALNSLTKLTGAEEAEILLVGEVEIITKFQTLFNEICGEDNKQSVVLFPTEEQDLFEKINAAVAKCTTPYFSLLEFDDTFYPYWDEVAQRYLSIYDYSIVMPITEIVTPDGKIAGFANEIAWDAAFVGEDSLGVIKLNDLLIFKDFIPSGAYIRVSDFLELGGLKPELKIAAWYEYLMNTAHNNKSIIVAPRIGYKHTILRETSYMTVTTNTLTREEGVALIQQAMEPYVEKENKNNADAGDEK